MLRPLSKSKLIAHRQCPKRMWLEIKHPELREDSAATQAVFAGGHLVGELARQIYDPSNSGTFLDMAALGVSGSLAATPLTLQKRQPVFEAGFSTTEPAGGAMAFADVMLPTRHGAGTANAGTAWRMVEVKSSTSVKDYHRDDVAIQAFVARASGVNLVGVALAHVDTHFVYAGAGDYKGLLHEVDLTQEAFARADEVRGWIAAAQSTAARRTVPIVAMGAQCTKPFPCGFAAHCSSALAAQAAVAKPEQALRFNAAGAQAVLAAKNALSLPVYFLDFETIMPAVPLWAGTRPYQQQVFQYSVHKIDRNGALSHEAFLDTTGDDPATHHLIPFLLQDCGQSGAVVVYNQNFEGARLAELATRFPEFEAELLALKARLVDLLPIARQHYEHPDQGGSWSIKKLFPTLPGCTQTGHAALAGVQTSGDAPLAYHEATNRATSPARKAELVSQLLAYCRLDTLATVKLWAYFAGRPDLMNLEDA